MAGNGAELKAHVLNVGKSVFVSVFWSCNVLFFYLAVNLFVLFIWESDAQNFLTIRSVPKLQGREPLIYRIYSITV